MNYYAERRFRTGSPKIIQWSKTIDDGIQYGFWLNELENKQAIILVIESFAYRLSYLNGL